MADILESKDVKIKKPHCCFGCGRKFEVGSTLRYTKEVDQGEFSSAYWCKTCLAYWDRNMEPDDEIGYGDLRFEDQEGWEKLRKEIEDTN